MTQQDSRRTEAADAGTLAEHPGEGADGAASMGARAEEFTREISELKLSGSSAETEARALKLGIAGLVIPIVMAIVGMTRIQ